jgi:pimeloyl-ACP methyl ester carboxylesterase
MPILALGGERSNGVALGQQIKLVGTNVTVVVLRNTGHWLLDENPRETMDALLRFL